MLYSKGTVVEFNKDDGAAETYIEFFNLDQSKLKKYQEFYQNNKSFPLNKRLMVVASHIHSITNKIIYVLREIYSNNIYLNHMNNEDHFTVLDHDGIHPSAMTDLYSSNEEELFVEKNFKNGDRVIVRASSEYKSKYESCMGTVVNYENDRRRVPVKLDNYTNEKSSYGYFYFNKTSLKNGSLIQGKTDILNTTGNKELSWLWINHDNKDNEEENTNMKTVKIIELWYANESESLATLFKNKLYEITCSDENYIKYKEHKSAIIDIILSANPDVKTSEYSFCNIEENIPKSKATIRLLDICIEERDHWCVKLKNKNQEIKAVVSACETYEQEIKILQSYGIIDSDYKLIH